MQVILKVNYLLLYVALVRKNNLGKISVLILNFSILLFNRLSLFNHIVLVNCTISSNKQN